jgi:hypothetical protein
MRIKLIAIATVVAALAIGVGMSNAALQNSVSVNVKFKKPGAGGTVSIALTNEDTKQIVPQRISQMIVTSKSVKWNKKALPYCNITIPTNAAGNNTSAFLAPKPGKSNPASITKACPLKSLVGTGTFTAKVGTPGAAYDCGSAACISGYVYLYNYKPQAGDQAAFVAWINSDIPVQNANQYMYVGVNKKGTITSNLPDRGDIPPTIADNLPAGSIAMTSLNLKLTAPNAKKPIFTIKSFKNLDVSGSLVRVD